MKNQCLAKAGFFALLSMFAATMLSNSGVSATEDNLLHITVSHKRNFNPMPAIVINAQSNGTIEIIRPDSTRLASALVMTGVSLKPSSQQMEALRRNDFVKMAVLYRNMVVSGYDTSTARLGLATALWLNGDLNDALHAFSWAKNKDPNSPSVHMGMALVMMELGAQDQAEQELSPLIDTPSQHAAALNNLGSLFREKNNLTLAKKQFYQALKSSPLLASAQYNLATTQMDMNNFKQAAIRIRKLAEQLPRVTEFYLNEGIAHIRAKEPILAAVALNRARELDHDNPAITLALGLTDQNLGLDTQAASLLTEAIEHNPGDERIHQLLATSLLRIGQVHRAAKVLEHAFALAPRNAEEQFQQGLKMLLCDKPILASDHFFKAMSKGKKDSNLFFAWGQSLLQADKVDAAIESLSVASRLNPASADIHFALGIALRTADKNDQAIREMKTASALKPNDLDMQILLMDTLRNTGKYNLCVQVGNEIMQSHPELVSPRFNLALCQALSGELELSIVTLNKAIKMDIDGVEIKSLWKQLKNLLESNTHNPGVYLLWATIQTQRGNWDIAIQAYEKFILSNPPKPWVLKALKKIRHLSPEPDVTVLR